MTEYKMRRTYFIDKSFQAKFILRFCLIAFASAVLTMGLLFFLSQNSNTVAIEDTKVIVKTTADFILPLTAQTILVALIFSSLAVIALTLFFSHKISGPLYRLTKEVEAIEHGDLTRSFKTRGKDQLQIFAQSLFRMASRFKGHCADLKQQHASLKKFLEDKNFVLSDDEKKRASELLKEIDEKLNTFKTS